jgi:hypothetical protein
MVGMMNSWPPIRVVSCRITSTIFVLTLTANGSNV